NRTRWPFDSQDFISRLEPCPIVADLCRLQATVHAAEVLYRRLDTGEHARLLGNNACARPSGGIGKMAHGHVASADILEQREIDDVTHAAEASASSPSRPRCHCINAGEFASIEIASSAPRD